MTTSIDLSCTIYINAQVSRQDLAQIVAQAVGGKLKRHTIYAPQNEIDVKVNDEYSEACSKDPEDGFLYFRYYMDIDALPEQREEAQIALVGNLLKALWARGFLAVAACHYEDKLPGKGYNRRSAA